MVALQIRDVPKQVRDVLAAQGAGRGQSLQAFLLALVEAEARRAANRAVLEQFEARSDGSRAASGDGAAELAEVRAWRERTLSGPSRPPREHLGDRG